MPCRRCADRVALGLLFAGSLISCRFVSRECDSRVANTRIESRGPSPAPNSRLTAPCQFSPPHTLDTEKLASFRPAWPQRSDSLLGSQSSGSLPHLRSRKYPQHFINRDARFLGQKMRQNGSKNASPDDPSLSEKSSKSRGRHSVFNFKGLATVSDSSLPPP